MEVIKIPKEKYINNYMAANTEDGIRIHLSFKGDFGIGARTTEKKRKEEATAGVGKQQSNQID